MDDAKKKLVDKLKSANNILVTVSRNPSVDQLSALLGLTLALNKQGKHAVAVFSGQVPSTIEFLKPEETIEKTTDSLRDFIIALDKNKADKLRYKVENDVVRIFITPYRTSISEEDFNFSQGDFNVDVVVALGVRRQEDLDEAITAHGRILHDATVATIDVLADGKLGTINWHVPQASSLSELVTDLAQSLGEKVLDEQIATALLTGIISATDRFSNEKTSSQTMSLSAMLMSAGANQQLVTSKLAEMTTGPAGGQKAEHPTNGNDTLSISKKADDGAMEIDHKINQTAPTANAPVESPKIPLPTPNPPSAINLPPTGPDLTIPPPALPPVSPPSSPTNNLSPGPRMITEPPTMGGTLTANSTQPMLEPTTDPLSLPSSEPPHLIDRQAAQPPPPSVQVPPLPTPPVPSAPVLPAATPTDQPPAGPSATDSTLAQLEKAVDSPHLTASSLDSARTEVNQALSNTNDTSLPEPIQALHAQPLGNDLHAQPTSSQVIITSDGSLMPAPPDDPILGQPPADSANSEDQPSGAPMPPPSAADAPPPVPPPIPFQFG